MINWNEEFNRLAQYEQERKKKVIQEQAQREAIVKIAFCKMMDAYTVFRRAGYDVAAKVFDTEWGEYEFKQVHGFNLFQVKEE